jgi:hypothetical protein
MRSPSALYCNLQRVGARETPVTLSHIQLVLAFRDEVYVLMAAFGAARNACSAKGPRPEARARTVR